MIASVLAYHEATKHHTHRYARSPGYLDWDNQPDPWRRYQGAETILLPFGPPRTIPYAALERPSVAAEPPAPVDLESISRFFELSLAITAWKSHAGSRWALRANPSSGNLHPTEGYAILPQIAGIAEEPSLVHYRSDEHLLERRAVLPAARYSEALSREHAPGSFLVGLSSIHWREAWKYGERAFRYCQHDAGHALAALRYAAAVLGWRLRLLPSPSDEDVSSTLGLGAREGAHHLEIEHPDFLAVVETREASGEDFDRDLTGWTPGELPGIHFVGSPNRLSSEHVDWPLIGEAARATAKIARGPGSLVDPSDIYTLPPLSAAGVVPDGADAARIIRKRRSALAFDGKTVISAAAFYGILDTLLVRPDVPPFDALPHPPCVHLAIFVHRVESLERGLYLLVRRPAALPELRASLRDAFDWRKPPGAPPHLPFYLLGGGSMQEVAGTISCQQHEIAGDAAFSLGMIAEFEPRILAAGAWFYRRLFWETGMIGQAIYLGAEARGLRATGIGCYFDDLMHELLGIRSSAYQSLYHCAVGAHVDDPRLTTLPAYDREPPERRGR